MNGSTWLGIKEKCYRSSCRSGSEFEHIAIKVRKRYFRSLLSNKWMVRHIANFLGNVGVELRAWGTLQPACPSDVLIADQCIGGHMMTNQCRFASLISYTIAASTWLPHRAWTKLSARSNAAEISNSSTTLLSLLRKHRSTSAKQENATES